MTIRPRRSALYLPASNPRAIEKARSLSADVIILDLEDAVAPEMKEEARAAAAAAVRDGGFGPRELVLRVNGLDTPWGEADLKAAVEASPDAILVPKVSSAADVARYDRAVAGAHERTRLWAMIETCASISRLAEIGACAGTTRLALLVMGTNDLAKESRARLRPGRTAFLPLLTMAVMAARENGLAILDGVCNEFRDVEAFGAEAEQGLDFGFDGKTLIHPDQISRCNMVFSPSEAELVAARAVVDAFTLPENAGKGAIRVDGKMVELLHLAQARQTIEIANAIAALAA